MGNRSYRSKCNDYGLTAIDKRREQRKRKKNDTNVGSVPIRHPHSTIIVALHCMAMPQWILTNFEYRKLMNHCVICLTWFIMTCTCAIALRPSLAIYTLVRYLYIAMLDCTIVIIQCTYIHCQRYVYILCSRSRATDCLHSSFARASFTRINQHVALFV